MVEAHFKGQGKVLEKKIIHKTGATKVFSWFLFGPIGYVLLGRDKKKRSKVVDEIEVTAKHVYVGGNHYAITDILKIQQRDKKVTIHLKPDSGIIDSLPEDKILGASSISIQLIVHAEDSQSLFQAVKAARREALG